MYNDIEKSFSKAEYAHDFQAELESITSRKLTPEIIDIYASKALDDLITLLQRVVESYQKNPSISFESDADTETAAFRYFHLGDVETLLDHIADKADEINHLDNIINNSSTIDSVIVPPDNVDTQIENGADGVFKEKEIIPRLKTLLFVLENEFGIDASRPEEVMITSGIMSDTMVRQNSYYQVQIPGLDRTVLVCDEEANATYVIDNKKLQEQGFGENTILGLTKKEINRLLEEDSQFGRRIVYSGDFIANIVEALQVIEAQGLKEVSKSMLGSNGEYLVPPATTDILSVSGIAKKHGVDRKIINNAINALEDTIGKIGIYSFRNKPAKGFNLEQQALIEKHLLENGKLFIEQAPKDILSINGVARIAGVNRRTVEIAISEIANMMGVVKKYKFGPKTADGYTVEQQTLITQQLKETDKIVVQATKDVLSTGGISGELRVAHHIVAGIIEKIGDSLGEVKKYKFSSRIANGYTVEQQLMIEQELVREGKISEFPPEDVYSSYGLAKKLGVSQDTMQKAVTSVRDELGDVKEYRFSGKNAKGYTPDQQLIIERDLLERGIFAEANPESVLSVAGIAKKLQIKDHKVKKVIDELGDKLGDVKTYKFGTAPANGYNLEQQKIIEAKLT